MEPSTESPARGLLNPRAGAEVYREALIPPGPDLVEVVAHHWGVRWDLRDQEPYLVEVLPGPSVVLAVEDGRCRVHGVLRGRFRQRMEGVGDIFGTSFRPAGFHLLYGRSLSELTDRVLAGTAVFGSTADTFADRIAATSDRDERVRTAEDFVHAQLGPIDPMVVTLNAIVDDVMAHREIIRVDDIVTRAGLGKRTLQRLFRDYLGVTPKWVIQRYRLHEAAQRLDNSETDLATLAADLGYADQAHFARDFKAVVGRAPTFYRGE